MSSKSEVEVLVVEPPHYRSLKSMSTPILPTPSLFLTTFLDKNKIPTRFYNSDISIFGAKNIFPKFLFKKDNPWGEFHFVIKKYKPKIVVLNSEVTFFQHYSKHHK